MPGAPDGHTPEVWRYLDLDRQGPFENAATMPVLLRSVMEHGTPIAQTSVWGQTHLNVGWFDDVDATLDLAECAARGVQVIRRHSYGGGTAYYAAECACMWGFFFPKGEAYPQFADLDALLARFHPVMRATLDTLGLHEVEIEKASDLRWHGRKLGAITAQDVMVAQTVGGFFNLAPPDLDLYLAVARVPDDKFKDKIVKDLREYVCTAEEVVGHPVTYEAFRDALVAALESEAGVVLDRSELTDGERKGIAKGSGRVGGDEMIRRISSERFRAEAPAGHRVGFANHKGRKLCRAGVAIDPDGTISAAMLAGDMHVSPADAIDRTAEALVGAAAGDPAELRRRLSTVFEADDVRQADASLGVTTDDLLAAVEGAIAAAS